MQNIRTGDSFYTEMNYEKILWLINLRFMLIALLSMTFALLAVLKNPIILSASTSTIFVWNGVCLLINIFLLFDINYLKNKKHILIDESQFKYISLIHIDFDIIFVVMTILLTGGLESPLLILFIYNIVTTSFILHDNFIYFYTGITLVLLILTGFRFTSLPSFPFLNITFESHLYKVFFTVTIFSFLTYLSKYISGKLVQKQDELNNMYEHTYQLSITDRLTGLYDQTYFRVAASDALDIAQNNGYSCAMVMFDIDNFKEFNDTNGHLAGSRALVEIAEIMRRTFRKSDLLGKYGGDEFVILMEDVEEEYIPFILERFKNRIKDHNFNPQTQKVSSLTISLGASMFPQNGISVELLIDTADKAMYNSKKLGKNQLFIFNNSK
jgi:diguanylate cyclase (GGDEF)-like protein